MVLSRVRNDNLMEGVGIVQIEHVAEKESCENGYFSPTLTAASHLIFTCFVSCISYISTEAIGVFLVVDTVDMKGALSIYNDLLEVKAEVVQHR